MALAKLIDPLSGETTDIPKHMRVIVESQGGWIEIDFADRKKLRLSAIKSTSPSIRVMPVATNVVDIEAYQK